MAQNASAFSGIVLGAIFGIVGTIIGAGTTAYLNQNAEREKQQYELQLGTFKFDNGNYPKEFQQIKTLFDQDRNLSFMTAKTVSKLAAIERKYPGCANTLSEACRPAMVEAIQATREGAGLGKVPTEDIDLLIAPHYQTALEAFRQLNAQTK